MNLPYTSDGCNKAYHYHHGPSVAGNLSGGCHAEQTAAILGFLTSTDLTAWFIDSQSAEAIVYYTPRYWQKLVAAAAHATFDPHGTHKISLSYNDLHCTTCDHYVSKELEPEHWEDLCGQCYAHIDQCGCCTSCGSDPCECCSTCGSAPGWCECCSHCGEVECRCEQCEDCGNVTYYCSCTSGGLYGSTKKAPWAEREDAPHGTDLPTIAQCNHKIIDPIQAAANFYLLDAMKSGIRMSMVEGANDRWTASTADLKRSDSMLAATVVAADRSYKALVEYLAPNFLAYSLSAVGGELRYHRAVGGKILSSNRSDAWDGFVAVVQEKGADVLFDADTLFREFGGGAYGGERWGQAAKIVGQYLKGSMPAWLFVDRVFTLQHNGGCFLNKVSWTRRNDRGWSLDKMLNLLNAHSGVDPSTGDNVPTDWATLLDCATPEVRQMFITSDRAIRRLARRFGGDLPRIPRKAHSARQREDW